MQKLRKTMIACAGIMTSLSVFAGPVIPVHAASNIVYAIVDTNSDSLLIRKDPSMDGEIIASMKKGAVCRILEQGLGEDGTWSRIFSGGYTGYTSSMYLSTSATLLSSVEPQNGVIFNESAEIYTEADSSSDVLCSRNKGASEMLTGEIRDNWVQISVLSENKEEKGWVQVGNVKGAKIVTDAEPYFAPLPESVILEEKNVDEVSFFEDEQEDETVIDVESARLADEAEAIREDAKKMLEESQKKEEPQIKEATQPVQVPSSSKWTGAKLNRQNGTVQGPSGKETYYNLDMSGIVSSIKNHTWVWKDVKPEYKQNVNGNYWIREDGVKMLGNYIMVAAHLGVHPRGSLVETSLGTGVVVDTGGFAETNSRQIDVAVNW